MTLLHKFFWLSFYFCQRPSQIGPAVDFENAAPLIEIGLICQKTPFCPPVPTGLALRAELSVINGIIFLLFLINHK